MTIANEYLDLLFNRWEWINFCYDDFKEIGSELYNPNVDIKRPSKYLCVNPLKPGTTRKASNVASHRNFVIEFDSIDDPHTQVEYMNILGIPYSIGVFSGNKSVHFIIALKHGVSSDLYRNICSRLKRALKRADKACFEPARLTRMPNLSIGQEIFTENYGRVDVRQLEDWLEENGYTRREQEEIVEAKAREVVINPKLTRMSKAFLACQIPPEEAHRASIQTAKNLHELGHSFDEIVEILTNVRVFTRQEDVEYAKIKVRPVVKWVFKEWIN